MGHIGDVPLPDLSAGPTPDTVEQAVRTLFEVRTLAGICLRLGVEARPARLAIRTLRRRHRLYD